MNFLASACLVEPPCLSRAATSTLTWKGSARQPRTHTSYHILHFFFFRLHCLIFTLSAEKTFSKSFPFVHTHSFVPDPEPTQTQSVLDRIISTCTTQRYFLDWLPFFQAITGDFNKTDVVRFLHCLTSLFFPPLVLLFLNNDNKKLTILGDFPNFCLHSPQSCIPA